MLTKDIYEKSDLKRRKEFFREFLSKKKAINSDGYLKPSTYETYIRDLNSLGKKFLKPRNLYYSTDIKEIESIKQEIKIMRTCDSRTTGWKHIGMERKLYVIKNYGNLHIALEQYISFLKTFSSSD